MSVRAHDDLVVSRCLPEDWQLWRDLRLRSLRTDPDAFGSSWQRERGFGESDWRGRLATSYAVTAFRDKQAVGMGGFFEEASGVVCVVAMWTVPGARGEGVGARVLAHVLDAVPPSAEVRLWVADDNPAQRLYLSAGFVPTGERAPIRPGARLMKSEMCRRPG